MSSSYTNWQHLMLGSSSRLICCLTMTSNAWVPTNNDGVEPYKLHQFHPAARCLRRRRDEGETHRRVIQDSTNITILDLIKWIDALDASIEQLMEHEADSCSSTQLVQAQVVRITVNGSAELGAEFGNNREYNVARVCVAHWSTESLEFGVVLLELLGNTDFDVWEGGADVMHEDLFRRRVRSS